MMNGTRYASLTPENDDLRRSTAIFEAHSLSKLSLDLAVAADHLSERIRKTPGVVDIEHIELRLAEVRRGCADVSAAVENVAPLAETDIVHAEMLASAAKDVFDQTELTYNQISFDVHLRHSA